MGREERCSGKGSRLTREKVTLRQVKGDSFPWERSPPERERSPIDAVEITEEIEAMDIRSTKKSRILL